MTFMPKEGRKRLRQRWDNCVFNNAATRFFQLMAATAQTSEARAVYLSFLNRERKLLSQIAIGL